MFTFGKCIILAISLTGGVTSLGAGPLPVATAVSNGSDNYRMVVQAPSDLTVGEKGTVTIKVIPTAGWHMNHDFPVNLSVQASPALGVDATKLRKDDAARFEDDGLVFRVPVAGSRPGTQTLSGTIRFAVCSDGACAPARDKFSVSVRVEPTGTTDR